MYKKIVSVFLCMLLSVGAVSPRIIDSFNNLLEKFNYIVSSDSSIISADEFVATYNKSLLETDLKISTVSMTEKQAVSLGQNVITEKDFIVKAETIDHNQFIHNFIGKENELYEEENLFNNTIETEGYTWNIPFVNGTEEDLGTLGNQEIKVGILDSGIANSVEFENVYRVDLVPDTTQDSLGIHYDVTGHGTNSAGIIAAAKNQYGIVGIAPNVSLYSIRVLDEDNEAPISRIIAGIEWAIENDIDVLNMSFGTLNYSSLLYQSIRRAYDSGMVLVASAGNTGEESNQVTYPAKFDEVISVGSCNQNGSKSVFSPESVDVDILAPGEYIDCVSLIDGYCIEQGTSLAAPHVTAAAALVLSSDNTKTPEFVKQLLISTANVSVSQQGILDIKNALEILPEFEQVESIIPSAIPENTEEFEEIEISEDVVVGSWSAANHSILIYRFSNPSSNDISLDAGSYGELANTCGTSKKNIVLFARAAYDADKLYGVAFGDKFSPLHAIGYTSGINSDSRKTSKSGSMNSNYVADTKYLYRLARHYFTSESVSAAHSSIDSVTKAGGTNYKILQAIVASSSPLYTKSDGTIVKGIVRMSIIDGYDESATDNAGWKILGLAAHLAADAYAHRTRVPLSSVNEGKWFYSTTAPNCFRGDNHIMKSGDNVGTRTPNQTKLKQLLKEQSTYQTQYVTNGGLCQCYDCLRTAISNGYVEFRDISGKYIDSSKSAYSQYNIDSTAVYPQRYNVGTKKAVEKLITQFRDEKDFTIFVFLPSASTGYTLKLNGLEYYIKETGTNWSNLQQTTKDLVLKYSTSSLI